MIESIWERHGLNQRFWERYDALDQKMDRLSEQRGLEHSTTDVFTPNERQEWRTMKRTLDDAQEEADEEGHRQFAQSQRSLLLGDDPPVFDGAW
jgi:dephospho-CoA kinase